MANQDFISESRSLMWDWNYNGQDEAIRYSPRLIAQGNLFSNEPDYYPFCSMKKPEVNPTTIIAKRPKGLEGFKKRYLDKDLIPVNTPTEGKEEMPCVLPFTKELPKSLCGLDESVSPDSYMTGMHGFCHDYVLEQRFRNPYKVLDKASRYYCAIGPQFSVLMDGRRCEAVEAVRRNRLYTLFLQINGIPTIQSVSLTSVNFFDIAYDGLAPYSPVAIENICKNEGLNQQFLMKAGLEELIRRKHPTVLLVYGNPLKFELDVKVVTYKSRIQKLRDNEYK